MKIEYVGREVEEVWNHSTGKWENHYRSKSRPIAIISVKESEMEAVDTILKGLVEHGYEYAGGFDAEEPYCLSLWFGVENREEYQDFVIDYKELKASLKRRSE